MKVKQVLNSTVMTKGFTKSMYYSINHVNNTRSCRKLRHQIILNNTVKTMSWLTS